MRIEKCKSSWSSYRVIREVCALGLWSSAQLCHIGNVCLRALYTYGDSDLRHQVTAQAAEQAFVIKCEYTYS